MATKDKVIKSIVTKKPLTPRVKKATPIKKESKIKVKKVAEKKNTIKKITNLTKTRKTTKKERKEEPSLTEEVKLPNNMSLRAIEKSAVLSSELDEYIKSSVLKVAYASGLSFIAVGTALTANLLIPNVPAISLTGNTINSTVGTLEQTITVNAEPEFSFIAPPPSVISEPTIVKFSLTNITKLDSKLVRVGQSGFYDLNTEIISDSKYKVNIPAASLPAGYYQLRIYAVPVASIGSKLFESKVFQVGEPTEAEPIIEDKTEPIVNGSSTPLVEITDTTNVTESFEIFTNTGTVLSGFATIGLKIPTDVTYVELYARPLQSLSTRFVTLAAERYGRLRFDFDSSNIPNGDYEFFAKAKVNGELKTTKSLRLRVSNSTYQINPPATETKVERPLITVEDTTYVPEPVLENDIIRTTDELILEYEAEINNLLQRYAIARQSGNELMIQTALEALKEKRESIIFNIIQDESTKDIADEIDNELNKFVINLQEKVENFEQIRKDRSEGETAKDTDKDGISDFDEINIYSTDPESSDSDKDGVIDGIEIIKGFNPLNDSAEAVIEFKSPQQSVGLVRNDIMKIENVVPVIEVNSDTSVEIVKAEISGKALPNSFVTLFIFSSPTVVTIKTDADGSFKYTFSKELEDGEHEIYVAITDNTGDIIAQSNPFSFIKKAQAFTPVDAKNEVVQYSDPQDSNLKKDTVNVVGMGILALGLILIMLGVSLRSKPEEKPNLNQSETV